MKPAKYHAKEKKNEERKAKEEEGKKAKRKSEDRCVTFKPRISKFYFLRMPELRKLIFCIWIRRSRGVPQAAQT